MPEKPKYTYPIKLLEDAWDSGQFGSRKDKERAINWNDYGQRKGRLVGALEFFELLGHLAYPSSR